MEIHLQRHKNTPKRLLQPHEHTLKSAMKQKNNNLKTSCTTPKLCGFLWGKNEREQRENTIKHPASVWFPWCVIRQDYFDVCFLHATCDRGKHPPWNENGLRRKDMGDLHSKIWRNYERRLFYRGRGSEDLNLQQTHTVGTQLICRGTEWDRIDIWDCEAFKMTHAVHSFDSFVF